MKKKKTVKRKVHRKKKLECSQCGLVVSVDNECGCMDSHEIMCCGTKMKSKK